MSSSQANLPSINCDDHRHAAVAIVLVNWNGAADCIDCLDSLVGLLGPTDHVYLVDNASSDSSLEKIAAWCARPTRPPGAHDLPGVVRHSATSGPAHLPVRWVDALSVNAPTIEPGCMISLIRSGANRGFAGGNNVGIKLGLLEGAEWFWLLNTDTIVDQSALHHLLERASKTLGAGIVGSTLVYHDSPDEVQALCGGAMNPRTFVTHHIGIGSNVAKVPTDPTEVEAQLAYVVGASMLVSRDFVEQVGLMQEDYFLYGEEIDWAARGAGRFRQCWAPQSKVFHKVGNSSAKVMPEFSTRLMLRNRLRYVERLHTDRVAAARRQLWWEWLRHLLKRRFAAARIVRDVLAGRAEGNSPASRG